jgi:hypothetical protein
MEEVAGAKKPRLADPPVHAATEATGAMLADEAKKDFKKVVVLEGVVVFKKQWSSKHSGACLDWKLHSLQEVDGKVTEVWHGVAKQ